MPNPCTAGPDGRPCGRAVPIAEFRGQGCPLCSLWADSGPKGQRARARWEAAGTAAPARPPGARPAPPAGHTLRPSPAEPSAGRKLLNFAGAVARTVAAGGAQVDDTEYARRLSVCGGCPFRDPVKDKCKLCGCPLGHAGLLPPKARLASEDCPCCSRCGLPRRGWPGFRHDDTVCGGPFLSKWAVGK